MGKIQKAIAAIYAEKQKMGKIRQQDLAKALGCSQATVSHILNGSRALSEKWIESLCGQLGITLGDIEIAKDHLPDTVELRATIDKLRVLYQMRPDAAFRNIDRNIDDWLQVLPAIRGSISSDRELNPDETGERIEESGIKYLDSDAPRPVSLVSVPYYNAVPAGDPRDITPAGNQRMNIVHSEAKETWYTLRVWGDSMSPDFLDGDIVLMDYALKPKNGDIVAALIDGSDSTLKVFSREGDEITLTPIETEHHSPRTFHAGRVEIQGVLVEIVRRSFRRRTVAKPHQRSRMIIDCNNVLDTIRVAGRSKKNPFGTWLSIKDDAVPDPVVEMIIDQLCETEGSIGIVRWEGSVWIWKR